MTESPAQANVPVRDSGLDLWRGLAVVGMVACHCVRLVPYSERNGWISVILETEPLVQAAFLWALGTALVHSWRKQPGGPAWIRTKAMRAVLLYCAGIVLFSLQFGWQGWEGFRQAGFLGIAAVALITGALLLHQGAKSLVFLLLGAFGIGVSWAAEGAGWVMAPWNGGSGPWLPLVPLAWLAVGIQLLEGRLFRWVASGAALLLSALSMAGGSPLDTLGNARVSSEVAILSHGTHVTAYYYTISARALPLLLTACFLVLPVLSVLLHTGWILRLSAPLLLLGQRPLRAYFVHLALLGGLVLLLGVTPVPASWCAVLIVVVVSLTGLFSMIAQTRIHGSVGLERRPPEP